MRVEVNWKTNEMGPSVEPPEFETLTLWPESEQDIEACRILEKGILPVFYEPEDIKSAKVLILRAKVKFFGEWKGEIRH